MPLGNDDAVLADTKYPLLLIAIQLKLDVLCFPAKRFRRVVIKMGLSVQAAVSPSPLQA